MNSLKTGFSWTGVKGSAPKGNASTALADQDDFPMECLPNLFFNTSFFAFPGHVCRLLLAKVTLFILTRFVFGSCKFVQNSGISENLGRSSFRDCPVASCVVLPRRCLMFQWTKLRLFVRTGMKEVGETHHFLSFH